VPTCDKLSEISQAFAKALFVTFPHWEALAKVVQVDDAKPPILELTVPQDGTDRVLYLSTADDEITVGFDYWHSHIGPFLGIETGESVEQAIGIIEAFVNEQTVVIVTYREGKWVQSSLHNVSTPPELETNSTSHIFSWKRTYDDQIETP
jgi:hypothetical protein